jgi:hypothetical protein
MICQSPAAGVPEIAAAIAFLQFRSHAIPVECPSRGRVQSVPTLHADLDSSRERPGEGGLAEIRRFAVGGAQRVAQPLERGKQK